MPPTRAADLPAAMFVQSIVNRPKDLETLGNQRFHQDSEEAIGGKVSVPSPLSGESVDGGEALGLMEPHGQNHPADGVLAHCQHPSDQQRDKDTETRSAQTGSQTNLVYRKRLWYTSLHSAFLLPGLLQFTKTGYARNALFFQLLFMDHLQN